MAAGMVLATTQLSGAAPAGIPAPPDGTRQLFSVIGGPPVGQLIIGQQVPRAVQQRAQTQSTAPQGGDIPLGGTYPGLLTPGQNKARPLFTAPGSALITPNSAVTVNANPRRGTVMPYGQCTWGTLFDLVGRMRECSGGMDWVNYTTLTQGGVTEVTGQTYGRVKVEAIANPDRLYTTVYLDLEMFAASGLLGSGLQITPSMSACNNCHAATAPQTQHIQAQQAIEFVQLVVPTVALGAGQETRVNFVPHLFSSSGPNSTSLDVFDSAYERCQNSMAYTGSAMCNFNGIPGLLTYSRAAGSPNQAVAQHIVEAWVLHFHPDHIGDVNTGTALHRTRNQALMTANTKVKDTLCVLLLSGERARLPQTVNPLNCDEYPFASTVEGGYYSNGDPARFSVKYVDATQNKSAGADLNNLVYRAQAISDMEPFYVLVP